MKEQTEAARLLERVKHLSDEVEYNLRNLEFCDRYESLGVESTAIKAEGAEAFAAVEDMLKLRRRLQGLIDKLSREEYKTLLRMRYFGKHTWKYIAGRMFYNPRHIFALHDSALVELDQIIKEERHAEKT